MKIFKYPLRFSDTQIITEPIVKILDIQLQNGTPCLWALVDGGVPRKIGLLCVGTGEDIPIDVYDGISYEYISTTQFGKLVFHWFAGEV